MANFGKVAVLMGGDSAERVISLQSGSAVLDALQRQGINAHKVDAGRDLLQQLEQGGFDRAFIMLHGRGGEDGVVQGALEQIGMPYTGSGVLGSSLGMDKVRCKLLWSGCQLPTPAFVVMQSEADVALADRLGYPQMIKPAHEGSSIGMSRVTQRDELNSAWQVASQYDGSVLAESYVDGPEYTIAILAGEALPVIRLETPNAFYDYEAKYQSEKTQYHCPCGLSCDEELALQQLALQAFEKVGASGWGRVDLMLDGEGQPWLIEVNTVPGMTDHSLVPMAAKAAGISFDRLVWHILATSLEAD
ncbi:MAG: D-alanine--D-alanine ligase [Candidatus Polarisedimenticolaceae bacterium]|nr:D-alanine--D-alanine ligase [Candidatus Polarisedimenticolaceae bacterium]